MKILGLESSCDETAAAIVEDGTKIISHVVASSQAMHAKFGGIIPDKAAREQVRSIIPVIQECILQANQKTQTIRPSEGQILRNSDAQRKSDSPSFPGILNVDALAVTVGPGLIGSLLVGVETAKALALAWEKPLIPVNHLIGHIYANWLTGYSSLVTRHSQTNDKRPMTNDRLPKLPALVLLVSGGHTELILMKNHGDFKLLGSTRDDAAGECFDKCARLLNLGYPGGPAIENAAESFIRSLPAAQGETFIKLPRPMINDKSLDFSFSGLKTAVANIVKYPNYLTSFHPNFLAYELQEAVTDVLVSKTLRAAQKYSPKSILLAGGVAANKNLHNKLLQVTRSQLPQVTVYIPPINLCTDNAAFIAGAAFYNYHPVPVSKINADPGLNI